MHDLAAHDDLHVGDRGDLGDDADPRLERMRTRPRPRDRVTRPAAIDLEEEQGGRRDEAPPRGRPLEPGGELRLLLRFHVGPAIAERPAGGVVAGADAGDAIADVEHRVPVGQLDAAVDAELEELHGAHVLLDDVGVDGLGVAAVGVDGEAPLAQGLAPELAVEGPVVGVDLLPGKHQVVAPEQVQMPIRAAPILLSRGDQVVAAARDRGLPQAAELGRVHRLHDAVVGPGRLVVGEDRAVADVLGLHQVEDHAVVRVVAAREVEVRVPRMMAERLHVDGPVELELDLAYRPGGDLDAGRPGPVLEPLEGLDPHRARRDLHLDLPRRVEEPPVVPERRLALAVPLAGLRPLTGQAVRGEVVRLRLIEIPVRPDDVQPAGRRLAGRPVHDRDPQGRGLGAGRRPGLTGPGEAGRSEEYRVVVGRDGCRACQ